MSATASDSGHRADDRRGPPGRRATQGKRSTQDYERELRRHELGVGRSLTQALPSDRPARLRELAEARRVLSGAIRDLRQLKRELEVDLERYAALRSRNQREVLAYEAVAGEIDEVLERWEARRDQLADAIERGGGRPPGGGGGRGSRPNRAGQSNRAGQANRPSGQAGRAAGQAERAGQGQRREQGNQAGQANRGGQGQGQRREQGSRGGQGNRDNRGGHGGHGGREGRGGAGRRRT